MPLSLKPIAFLFDELFSSCISTLLSKLDEVISKFMPVDSLCCNIDTSLQFIQSLCALEPCHVASSHHLTAEHISDSLQLGNLLKRSPLKLRSMDLSFGLELVDQILVFIEVVLSNS